MGLKALASSFMDELKDCHMPIGIAVFITTTIYHFKTGRDLGPQYVNSIYALYGFLAGHAWVNRDNGPNIQK